MENKINIAELLKDCPKGTKLYSPLVGECTLEHIHGELKKILISTSDGTTLTFNNNGTYFQIGNSECLLFPSKDQRDWSKFQRPFKDGDVISVIINYYLWYGIYQKEFNDSLYCYVSYSIASENIYPSNALRVCSVDRISEIRLATEEEKQKLFDAIKANGYKWNAETKTLEKLPKFKVGDRVKKKDSNEDVVLITDIADNYYIVETKYGMEVTISMSIQNNYELVPYKFDINTLKPFESKVLVRSNDVYYWKPAIFGFYDKVNFYMLGGSVWKYCIPYKGNEHLLGTANDCDNYYKNWE